jgi:hypothetical protein
MADVIGVLPEGPVFAPTVTVLHAGHDRLAFLLLDTARKELAGAAVALYVSEPDGTAARGPYVAHSESLAVRPEFRSLQNAEGDAPRSLYVAHVPFRKPGEVAIVAVAKLDGRLVASSPHPMSVGDVATEPPGVGDRAPVIHTETLADARGDLSKIDTRRPPLPGLHDVDAADVLGKKPVVLVFATPQLCRSRVCAPVLDVVAEVQWRVGHRVQFVHQEVYADNTPSGGFRPQLRAYRLRTEPWTFVIARDGHVAARFEGAYSVRELERAVAKVR